MRILGVDPGVGRVGWGIIDDAKGKQTVVSYDCIETTKNGILSERLLTIFETMTALLLEYSPEAVAVEELFFNTNTTTAMMVGHGRGVILLAAAMHSLPVFSYTPLQVKMAMTGYGRAEKNQIGQMVKLLLRLEKIPKPDDTADALAVALTYAFSRKNIKR